MTYAANTNTHNAPNIQKHLFRKPKTVVFIDYAYVITLFSGRRSVISTSWPPSAILQSENTPDRVQVVGVLVFFHDPQ